MGRKEIGHDGIWTIPAERYKTKRPNHVPLSKTALALIQDQPKFDGCDYVFPSRARTPYSGFGKSKARLDKATLAAMKNQAKKGAKIDPIPNWTLHDLRRTAKTLMVRAGVRPDISERVLGHVIAGVEGTYDRHSYADEKQDALETLATMVDRILNPPPSNVRVLAGHRGSAQPSECPDSHGREMVFAPESSQSPGSPAMGTVPPYASLTTTDPPCETGYARAAPP